MYSQIYSWYETLLRCDCSSKFTFQKICRGLLFSNLKVCLLSTLVWVKTTIYNYKFRIAFDSFCPPPWGMLALKAQFYKFEILLHMQFQLINDQKTILFFFICSFCDKLSKDNNNSNTKYLYTNAKYKRFELFGK